jgi:peptide/nickel transport system permease protein
MWKYLLRRVMLMVPSLFAIMVIAFMISRSGSLDPVEAINPVATGTRANGNDLGRIRKDYAAFAHQLGLDLPIFYFELSSLAYPDTLHHIINWRERGTYTELAGRTGNWEAIDAYRRQVIAFEAKAFAPGQQAADPAVLLEIQRSIIEFPLHVKQEDIRSQLHLMDSLVVGDSLLAATLRPDLARLQASFERIFAESTGWRRYVPRLVWHGTQNQFHDWLMRMVRFDFGVSYLDHRPVGEKITEALPWSIMMAVFAYLVSFAVAIPLGVFFVRKRGTTQDSVAATLLFLLYSVPTFVSAMLAMMLFCNPEFFYWFPVAGVRDDMHASYSLTGKVLDIAHHLVLPTLLYAYHGATLLSRIMRVSMLDTIHSDYIRTARAKGVNERHIIWRHAMRNSLLPVIGTLSGLPAALVTGSITIETIFSVPGMGNLVTQASGHDDHPVIVAVFTMAGLLTILGVLLGDILLALSDPRVTYGKA